MKNILVSTMSTFLIEKDLLAAAIYNYGFCIYRVSKFGNDMGMQYGLKKHFDFNGYRFYFICPVSRGRRDKIELIRKYNYTN